MSMSPDLQEKLVAIAKEAASYIRAGGPIIGHLEIAVSKAAYAAADAEREACARVVEAGQETTSTRSAGETRRHLTPRTHGNLAGLAYAAAIRERT